MMDQPSRGVALGHEPADVFISYKREEREKAETIAQALRQLGLNVWFDARLDAGTSFDEEINREVRAARAVLVLWSPEAVTSDWVRAEASIGRARNVLVSAFLAPCELYPPFNLVHTEPLQGFEGDARHKGWRKIVAALGKRLERPGLASYVEATERGETALWAWARRWPGDPLAAPVWDAQIAAAPPDQRGRLREERARLLAALTEGAAEETSVATPAKQKRIKATRPRRQGGYVMLLMLVTLVVQVAVAVVVKATGISVSSQLATELYWLVLVVGAVGASSLSLRRLWPIEGARVTIRRTSLILALCFLLSLLFVGAPMFFLSLGTGAGESLLGSPLLYATAAAGLVLFVLSPALLISHAVAGALLFFRARQLLQNAGWTRPTWLTRVKAAGVGVVFAGIGLGAWALIPERQAVERQLSVELRRVGYDAPTTFNWDSARSRFTVQASLGGSGDGDRLAEAARLFREDHDLPADASYHDILSRARSLRDKTEWRVNPDGSEDVTTIGEALRRAAPGATIIIAPGEYAENLQIEAGLVSFQASGVTLTGRQDDPATEADENRCGAVICINNWSGWQGEMSLEGMAIEPVFGMQAINGSGSSSGWTLADVFVVGADAPVGELPAAVTAYNMRLRNVRVSRWRGLGIRAECEQGLTCELTRLDISDANMGLAWSGNLTVSSAQLRSVDEGVHISAGATGAVAGSTIDNARIGLYAEGDAPVEFRNNRVTNVRQGCVWLNAGSNAIVRGNRFARCGTDGYYPIHVAADATGVVEDNVILASRNPIVFVEPGSTAIVRNNRDRD